MHHHAKAAFVACGEAGKKRGLKVLPAILALALCALGSSAPAALADPPAVTIDPASSLGFTKASATGTVDADGIETSYHFEYQSDAQVLINEGDGLAPFEFAPQVGFGTLSGTDPEPTSPVTIEGLTPGTTYHLRLVAEHTDGSGSEVAVAPNFTTLTATEPVLTLAPASEVKYTSAHLSGSVDPEGGNEEGGGPLPIRWEWQISKDPALLGWSLAPGGEGTIEGPAAAGTAPIGVPFDLTGLENATEYKFRLVASSVAAGTTVVSSEGSFETETVTPPLVSTNDATQVTGTSAHFSGHVTAGNVDPAFDARCQFDYLTEEQFGARQEVQRLSYTATGGTLNLAYKGEGTAVPFDATAAALRSALEGLAQIGPGGVSVTFALGDNNVRIYTITFTDPLDVPEVSGGQGALEGTTGPPSTEIAVNGHAPGSFEGSSTINCEPATATGTALVAVQADPTGLQANSVYHLRLRAENAGGQSTDIASTFETAPIAPGTITVAADSLSTGAAHLAGRVNPHNSTVTYQFEWGTDEGYGNVVPATSAPLGASDNSLHLVTAGISGLQAGTTYHFRISATNTESGETSHGEDRVFSTLPASGPVGCANEQRRAESNSLALPDCRGYELVMPALKDYNFGRNGSQIAVAAREGGAVAYHTFGPMPGSTSGNFENYNLARRGLDGWSNKPLSPPSEPFPGAQSNPNTMGFSEDLSMMVFRAGYPPLTPDAPADVASLYMGNTQTGKYTLLSTVPASPGFSAFLTYGGASADYTHVVFESQDSLTPDAPGASAYEWTGGQIQNVAIYPNETPASGGVSLGAGALSHYRVTNAVSDDGRRIVFTDGSNVYVRIDGTSTAQASASQRTVPDPSIPNAGRPTSFWAASTDVDKVFFTSARELTDNANTGEDGPGNPTNAGTDLYAYDVSDDELSDLSVDTSPNDGARGADVQGVIGVSDDGEYVYFVARGDLGGGADSGALNLYLAHAGQTRYVGSLDPVDSSAWQIAGSSESGSTGVTARIGPEGQLAIQSAAPLTGYDNVDPSTGQRTSQVYLYEPDSGSLICASCRPDGASPSGSSKIAPPDYVANTPRNLSEDGSRLFFDSTDAIVPADTNGVSDVYEWSNGSIHLISDGTSGFPAFFQDASADGEDVFFSTGARLVGQDTDGHLDLYDAHVGGGYPKPVPPAPPCEGEACRGSGNPAADAVAPTTAAFVGPGDKRAQRGNSRKHVGKARAACKGKHAKKRRKKCESQAKKHSAKKIGRGK